jgi:hypothetical protein
MEIVAHGLWAAAAAIAVKRTKMPRIRVSWTVWWAVFPDVLAFGAPIAVGLWLRVAEGAAPDGGRMFPHVHLGVPLYPLGHSIIVFALAFALTCVLARRVVYEMLGWLMHILIDIPTHSLDYYATRFLWPVSEFRVDGIAWWTPWFWVLTYVALAATYVALWRKGWLSRTREVGHALACPDPVDTRRERNP